MAPQPPVLTAWPKAHHVRAGGCWQTYPVPGGPKWPWQSSEPPRALWGESWRCRAQPKPPRTTLAREPLSGPGGFPRSPPPQLRPEGWGHKPLGSAP